MGNRVVVGIEPSGQGLGCRSSGGRCSMPIQWWEMMARLLKDQGLCDSDAAVGKGLGSRD